MNLRLWIVCAGCWLPGVALAECAARVQAGSVLISPWLAEELAHGGRLQQSLDVRVSGLQGCAPLLLGVSIDEVPDGTRARVRSAPNGAEVGEAPGGGQPLLSVIGAGGEALLNPVLEWSAEGQALAAGRQTVQLRWQLYAADALLPQSLATLESAISAEVPAVLEVELIAAGSRLPLAGASALLDFGEISTGSTRQIDLDIRANAPVQLALSRQFGELRLRGRPDYVIPYRLLLDGQPVDGSGTPQALAGSGTLRARLDVEIGELERRAAGVYEDTLTVVVAPE